MKARILMVVASLLLLFLFFFPIWHIKLDAPQYPEGINMYIWINDINGKSSFSAPEDELSIHTIENVNLLNHYRGMKHIHAEDFWEFKYFPWIIGGMLVLGLLFAFAGKRILYFVWAAIMGVAGVLGMYDFYKWEYDYGHNLSDTAQIKIPGMAYQPPFFGGKELLNFYAESYPAGGTYAMVLAAVLALVAFFVAKKCNKCNKCAA